MADITFGNEAVFKEDVCEYVSIAFLDSTHFVVAYRVNDANDYGYAVVGSISGTTISWGTPLVFNEGATIYVSVAALDSTHFVVAYNDQPGNNDVVCKVGVTSGTTISSYGAANIADSDNTNYTSIAALDSTHFVVVYSDAGNSNKGTAIVGVVSGTTISSYGSASVFSGTNYIFYPAVTALDSTHFVVAYKDGDDPKDGTAIIGLTSGTTISSFGTAVSFNSGDTREMSVVALDSTHFVVAYKDDEGDDYGIARVGVTSGTAISSFGSENIFNSANTRYTSVTALDSTHFAVAYKDDGGDDYGGTRVGTVSGTTISGYTDEELFNSAVTDYISVAALDDSNFVIAFKDTGNSSYGTGILGTYTAPASASTGNFFQLF